jgi:hypothetical protein
MRKFLLPNPPPIRVVSTGTKLKSQCGINSALAIIWERQNDHEHRKQFYEKLVLFQESKNYR